MANAKPIVKLVAETNDYEKKMRQANKTFNDFMKGIGMSTSKFTALSLGIGATTTALKVAKDAFFKNEQNLDEWGRTVESAKSIYTGFLNSLNTGDISGFLANIGRITQAAREAYDALDELNTFNAFNKVNIAKARAGLTGAIADFREGGGSKEGVQQASQSLIGELLKKQKLQQEAYVKAVGNIAAQRGVAANDLLKVMTGSYGRFSELKGVKMTGREMVTYSGGMFGGGGSYQKAVPRNERERLAQAVQQLNDTEIDTLQSMAEAAQMTEVEINNQRKQVARILNGNGGGSGGGKGGGGKGGGEKVSTEVTYAAGSIAAQEKLVNDLTKKWKEAGDAVRDGYRKQLDEAQQKLDDMINRGTPMLAMGEKGKVDTNALLGTSFGKVDMATALENVKMPLEVLEEKARGLREQMDKALTPEIWNNLNSQLQGVLGKIDAFKGISNAGKSTADSWQQAAAAIGSVGSALASIQDPAIRVAGIVAEAIANIALGFAQATAVDSKYGVFGWIAAIAGGLATMTSTIAAIKSATAGSFATGGIVPGNSFSGDNQLIAANSGEVILNSAQSDALAARLSGSGGIGNMSLVATLRGEDIRIALVNNDRRRGGRGEYATTVLH